MAIKVETFEKVGIPSTGRHLVAGVPNNQYHDDKSSISSSILKKVTVPAIARYYMDNPPAHRECFRIGTAVHTYILEPKRFDEQYLVGIDRARRSYADKEAWAAWFTEHGAAGDEIVKLPAAQWNPTFEVQSGRHMVTAEERANLIQIIEAIGMDEYAMELLADGMSELSGWWDDPDTGLRLRVRPDYLNDSFISDLKSADSIDDKSIDRAFGNLRYGISQAMYQDGIYKITGVWRPFLFIFVTKSPPYLCRVIGLKEEDQQDLYDNYVALKNKLAECLERNEWPGYPDDLDHKLPEWAL